MSSSGGIIKEEFCLNALLLDHKNPEHFSTSQWYHCIRNDERRRRYTNIFLVYRWLLAIFLLIATIISITGHISHEEVQLEYYHAKWPIYLTNWVFNILTIQAILAAILATKHYFSKTPVNGMTTLHKIYWVLNNAANTMSPYITIYYWSFLYKPDKHIMGFTNVTNHMLNSMVTLIDLFVAAHPTRLLHIIHPILVSLTYIAFSGVYYVAGGTNRENSISIYPILNWSDNPGRTLVLACALTMLLVPVHLVIWSLYLIRRRIATVLMNRTVDIANNVEAGQVKN